jgi:hypothetical protein
LPLAALLAQIAAMTPEQIQQLGPQERQMVLQLREQLQQQGASSGR